MVGRLKDTGHPVFKSISALSRGTQTKHLQDGGTSSVFCENLFAYSLTFSEFEIQIPSFLFNVQSMSLNIDMKMIRSVNFSGSMFLFCKLF